jgi:multidrug resistance protein MdtO
MTFRIPTGFLGAIFTLFISRENPTATFLSGFRSVLAFVIAAAYALITLSMLTANPLTHFLWVASSLFLSFFLIGIFADYGTAVAFGFMIAGTIPIWDQHTMSVELRVENTLWTTFVVIIGIAVSIAVEYVFRRVHPVTDLTEGIEVRLQTVEHVLRSVAEDRPLESEWEKKLTLYATVGTSRLRRLIVRSSLDQNLNAQRNTAIALLGRLVDITASFRLVTLDRATVAASDIGLIDEAYRERCRQLADYVAAICEDLMQDRLPRQINLPAHPEPSGLRFLPAMERTVTLIPKAFTTVESLTDFIPAPFDEEKTSPPLFVADAFSNPEHLKFAIRGALAATAAYFVYNAVAWPGLSTALPTCIITALSTIGSSRQKQFLRLGGAIIGGFIIGMGAQMFVLPYLDTIAGFTVLFAAVTALSAWISTASARLSYLGVQLALAFYLINLQEFTIQTSLAIARDRVVGVLLGLLAMWLIYDRLWVRSALEEMQAAFAQNLERFALLAEQLLEDDTVKSIRRVRQLRDQINAGFLAVSAQSDAVLFEFGANRRRALKIREESRRWQPSVRTLLQVQMTFWQYRVQRPLKDMPAPIAQAQIAFESDVAHVMRALANEVSGKPIAAVPDIQSSAARLQQEIRKYYQGLDRTVSTEGTDMMGLTETLASILAPLYEDIHATFASSSLQPA